MSDFEEYIKVNYPRDYERQKRIYPDQSMEELYSEDYKMWQHQQAIIDELKAQLNNMEACYIEKKKQVEGLHGKAQKALQEVSGASRFVNEDAAKDFDFLQGAVLRSYSRIEEALRGEP